MNSTQHQYFYELAFLILLMFGGFAIANAHSSVIEKKILLDFEITENGKITSNMKEVTLDGTMISKVIDGIFNENETGLSEAMNCFVCDDFERSIGQNGQTPDVHVYVQNYLSVFPNKLAGLNLQSHTRPVSIESNYIKLEVKSGKKAQTERCN